MANTSQAVGNDASGWDKSMESHSGGSRRELAALVARLLSMLSKKNSSSSLAMSSSSCKRNARAAAATMDSGGSWTSSTAGRTVFLLSIRQRLCLTRFRRLNSFLTGCYEVKTKQLFLLIILYLLKNIF